MNKKILKLLSFWILLSGTIQGQDSYNKKIIEELFFTNLSLTNIVEMNSKHLDSIEVEKPTLTFYARFSPDWDGNNDTFWIEGVEAYPKNELFIFNEAGEMVYKEKGYSNKWEGVTMFEMLSNGLYYYLFDDGEGELFTGYINLAR